MAGGSTTDRSERTRRVRSRVVSLLAVAALVALPGTVFAGKGGGTTVTPWIALASVDGASVAAAGPRLGATVRFNSGYPTGTKNAWVGLTCYQGTDVVYVQGGAPSADFSLGGSSSTWLSVGGAATCRAELGDLYWRGGKQYYTYLAHTNFEAGG